VRIVWVSFDSIGRDCLEAAAESGGEIAAVVTLPGPPDPERAGQCGFGEVAAQVDALLIESTDVNGRETIAAVRAVKPDMAFVVGWSQLVREEFLALAPEGVFGMHPTLLPRHRGRAPIPWAILSGLAVTGVTLFEIVDSTADSGPLVGQVEVPIEPTDTAGSLYGRLAEAHADLIREYLPLLVEKRAPRSGQDPRRASSWWRRTPADGIIDWYTRAPYLYDWVRAQTRPYPGAFTFLGDTRVIVWRAAAVPLETDAPVGTVVEARETGVVVACGDGGLLLEEVEPEGDGVLEAVAVGRALPTGARLG
jgi:methionyl-tRNA formyltransferase